MAAELPDHVVRFIADHIDSASLLDALLLLRAAPDKAWTSEELGRALVTGERIADAQLKRLLALRLVVPGQGGFLYSPRRHEAAIDDLADCYAKRRHSVVAVIYGADTRTAQTLGNAFRMRRRKS